MPGKRIFPIIKTVFLISIIFAAVLYFTRAYREKQVLNKIIERLSADSRVAEVMVADVKFDPKTKKNLTTIKFLEYDTKMKSLEPRYFTFSENIIQFQALVIRFDDFYVRQGHPLKGKSAYIFMKAFTLTDKGAQVFEINTLGQVPSGYEVTNSKNSFEKKLWKKFWEYALNASEAKRMGIKNAQIEAPGTKFVSGLLYTIKIEHDGGLRIDAQPLPSILKGEKIKF